MISCRTKKHYDTEFEATVAAAKSEIQFRAEMIPYSCGSHWHISHRDPSERGRYKKRYLCPHCKQIINRQKNPTHKLRCTMKP